MDIKDYEPLFGNWYVESFIGSGTFGKVYKIKREEFGAVYYSALKWISIPRDEAEMKQLRYDGLDNASISEYYKDVVTDLVNEMQLMSRLRGRSSIVSYEDHSVVPKSNNMGYDIFIRMELLISLNDYMQNHELSRADVIRLGINLCEALELCQKYNIIHRDIKPDNIFVAETGEFKLGDFGIARQLEKTTASLFIKGTYYYMAPEVYKGERYNSSVDTYSLGIVLYRLLNDGRLPFLPLYPAPVRQKDRDQSLLHRMSGERMFPPQNAEGRLGEIVLKACAYDSKDRYSSPIQIREELQAIQISKDDAKYVYRDGDNLGNIEPSIVDEHFLQRTSEIEVTEIMDERITDRRNNYSTAIAQCGQTGGQDTADCTQSFIKRELVGKEENGEKSNDEEEVFTKDKTRKTGKTLLKPIAIILPATVVVALLLIVWQLAAPKTGNLSATMQKTAQTALLETQAPAPTIVPTPTVAPTPTEQPDYVISLQDETFERGIRNALGKGEGEAITYYEVKDIEALTIDADETMFRFTEDDYSTARQYYGNSDTTGKCNTLSLVDLRYFTGLKKVSIFDTNIEDLNTLKNCKAVESIQLYGCTNVTMDWISALPSLKELSLSFCFEIDFSNMGESDSVSKLDLYWSNTPPLDELSKLANLKELSISSSKALVNVEALTTLKNLTDLSIGDCRMTKLDFLQGMQQLNLFSIYISNIRDISAVSALENLNWLAFEECSQIADLSALSNLTNLRTLFITECAAVTDLTPISGLTNLNTIWLNGDAKLSDITPLSDLINLKELSILRTNVKDITPLIGLPLERISANKNLEKSIREYFPSADLYVQ